MRPKQKKILDVAFNLFLKHGIKNTGIRDIANEANVSQVTIYNSLGKKSELIEILVKLIIKKNNNSIKEIMVSDIHFQEKLNQILNVKIEFIKNGEWKFIKNTMTLNKNLHNLILNDFKINSDNSIKKMINIGRKEGVISNRISNKAIAFYMQAITLYFTLEDENYAEYQKNPKLLEELYWIFWNGVLKK